jgi:hypothetical protein
MATADPPPRTITVLAPGNSVDCDPAPPGPNALLHRVISEVIGVDVVSFEEKVDDVRDAAAPILIRCGLRLLMCAPGPDAQLSCSRLAHSTRLEQLTETDV